MVVVGDQRVLFRVGQEAQTADEGGLIIVVEVIVIRQIEVRFIYLVPQIGVLLAEAVILLLQGVDLVQHLGIGLFQSLLVKRHIVALGQLPIQLLHLGIQLVQLLDVIQKGLLLCLRQRSHAADERRLVKVLEIVVIRQGIAGIVHLVPQCFISLEYGITFLLQCLDLLPDGILVFGGDEGLRLCLIGRSGKCRSRCSDGRYRHCQCQ